MRSIFLFMVVMLTGCAAGLDGDYSCNTVGGVSGCVGMHDVRDNIDAYVTPPVTVQRDTTAALEGQSGFTILPRRDRYGQPDRTTEVRRKVTVFPFTDVNGFYVDTTDIYIILDAPAWTGRPVQAIRED